MKVTVNFAMFYDAMMKARPENFTYDGLKILFDYIEEYEDACGYEQELDPIGFCCEFAQYTEEELGEEIGEDLSDLDFDEMQELLETHNYDLIGIAEDVMVVRPY